MSIPEATLTVLDGGLGVAQPGLNGTAAKVGCCSSGTANTVYYFSDETVLRSTLGNGPLVESAAHTLNIAGGPVMCVKSPSSTAGAAGSVTPTKTGTATLAVSGGALDAYSLLAVIIQGGATLVAGTATFKYSLDGGLTFSPELALPTGGVYAIPNTGLTLTWTYSSGTAFVAADQWAAPVSGPSSSLSEVQAAVAAALLDPGTIFNLHVVSIPADVAGAAALFAALDVLMSGAAVNSFRYLYATMELPPDTDANYKTGFLSLASTRVEVAAGYENIISSVTGAEQARPCGWTSTARAASVVPSEDLGRVATGPVRGVISLARDEFKTPGLDLARFTTMRTFVGEQGFFITTGRIMAPVGSDFSLIQHRRVMDLACATLRSAQLRYLNDTVVVDAVTGLITEESARSIENNLSAQLRAAITQPGYGSAVSAMVDRTVNILSTSTLKIKYRVTPLGYAKSIQGEIAFNNPALQAV